MIITVEKYEIGDFSSKEAVNYSVYLEDDSHNRQIISVYCSNALKTIWKIKDDYLLFESLYPLIRNVIKKWISTGIAENINEINPMAFTTHDAPEVPPKERYKLPDNIEIVKEAETTPDTYAVFISHANSDKELGMCIKDLLKEFHIKSFVAHEDIEICDIWEPTIIKTLENAKIMLILATKDIENSPWVNFEIGLAYKKMFPLIFDKLTDKVSYIKNTQGIPIDYDDIEGSLFKLIDKVIAKIGIIAEKNRDTIRALFAFKKLKQKIIDDYKPGRKERKAGGQEEDKIPDKLFYIARKDIAHFSALEVYNMSNHDVIDLDIRLKYVDKTGEKQEKEALVINVGEDPTFARHVACKLIRGKESKYIVNSPRVKTKVFITGKIAGSDNIIKESSEL